MGSRGSGKKDLYLDLSSLIILQELAPVSCSEGDEATQHADKGTVSRARTACVLLFVKEHANLIERPK